MNPEEAKAYSWARKQDYQSVSARYARILAGYIERQEKRRTTLEDVPKTAKAFLCRIYDAFNYSIRAGEPHQFPGHAHEKWGIWDSDNGIKAGKPCKDCESMRALHNALKPFWDLNKEDALTPTQEKQ